MDLPRKVEGLDDLYLDAENCEDCFVELLLRKSFKSLIGIEPDIEACSPLTGLGYHVYGDGPVKLCFLMGLKEDKSAWTHQIQYFAHASRRSKYPMLVLDNRGSIGAKLCFGIGKYREMISSTKRMALDCLDILDDLECHCFHLLGISMGGMISLQLALRCPQRVLSLCLVSTCAKYISPRSSFLQRMGILSVLVAKTNAQNAKASTVTLFPEGYLALGDDGGCLETSDYQSEYSSNRERLQAYMLKRVTDLPSQSTAALISQLLAVRKHHIHTEQLQTIGETIPH